MEIFLLFYCHNIQEQKQKKQLAIMGIKPRLSDCDFTLLLTTPPDCDFTFLLTTQPEQLPQLLYFYVAI